MGLGAASVRQSLTDAKRKIGRVASRFRFLGDIAACPQIRERDACVDLAAFI
jgi:hypothetical protein